MNSSEQHPVRQAVASPQAPRRGAASRRTNDRNALHATDKPRRTGRPPDPTLRQRRRKEILEAAAVTFAQRGYSETDLEVVAKSVGIAKATIYRYFRNKSALFLAVVDDGMRRLREVIDTAKAQAPDPLSAIVAAIRAYLEFFDRHPELVELFIQERAQFRDRKKATYFVYRDAERDRGREMLDQLVQAGRLRDLPVERVLDVVGDLLYGTLFVNHLAGRKVPAERQLRDIVDIVFHGILSEPERRALQSQSLSAVPARDAIRNSSTKTKV